MNCVCKVQFFILCLQLSFIAPKLLPFQLKQYRTGYFHQSTHDTPLNLKLFRDASFEELPSKNVFNVRQFTERKQTAFKE